MKENGRKEPELIQQKYTNKRRKIKKTEEEE